MAIPEAGPAPKPLPPPPKYRSAMGPLRHLIFGPPLATSKAGEEKLPKYLALPILSSNALSSNAYATEAILVLLVLAGMSALHAAVPIAIGICALLIIVSLSYIQIIYAYPNGGGAYPVSRENLNVVASLVAGASLMVDYVLTVAVSVAAGVAAIVSAWPSMHEHILSLCVIAVLLLTFANLRGVRESGRVFAAPTYVFIFGILATVIAGLVGIWTHAPYITAGAKEPTIGDAVTAIQPLTYYLLLQAFSQGCAALTGLEAVSNTVPIFERPQARNAASTMVWMGVLSVIMFFGLTYIADAFHIVPMDETKPGYQSVVSMVADRAWPHSWHWMYYLVQYSTAIVLLLAANTAFAGFPQLASMMARDRMLPRQLANLGDRLAFSNGIVLLAVIAGALIWIFKGRVNALLPMYAIGVFIGFTLAQTGMVVRWLKLRTKGWQTGLVFNGVGAVSTGIVAIIIGISKWDNGEIISPHFHIGGMHPHYGTWIVIVLIPILVAMFLRINKHYTNMDRELTIDRNWPPAARHHTVLVLVPRIHRGVAEALNYARLISGDVRAVYIEVNPESTHKLKADWEQFVHDLPLVIIESPSRSLIGPLLNYIDAVQEEREDDIITVIVSEFVSRKWWHRLLHNQHGPLLRFYLFNRRDVTVTNVRYFLES